MIGMRVGVQAFPNPAQSRLAMRGGGQAAMMVFFLVWTYFPQTEQIHNLVLCPRMTSMGK